jgi:hypothetical protein
MLRITSAIAGPYDRKVADTQYNLGLVCMLVAAEEIVNNQQQQQEK